MNEFTIQSTTRTDFINIDAQVMDAVRGMGLQYGVVTVFVPHTTAGVTINENADPDVVDDLKDVLDKAVPWQDNYRHMEGNTAAHAKAGIVGSSVQVIIQNGQVKLGTWQGIFFCEFDGPRTRKVWVKGTVAA